MWYRFYSTHSWHISESLHSIGSPLMNQLTVGRGAPSEWHTRRPLSSGAKTKSAGFSNQNGAAVSCKYISCFNIIAQRDGEKTLSASHLWPQQWSCAQCSPFCWSRCRRIRRHRQRMLLESESTCWNSLLSWVASPRDLRHLWSIWCEESAFMMTNKALNKMTVIKVYYKANSTKYMPLNISFYWHSHSGSYTLQKKFFPQQDQYGAGLAGGW